MKRCGGGGGGGLFSYLSAGCLDFFDFRPEEDERPPYFVLNRAPFQAEFSHCHSDRILGVENSVQGPSDGPRHVDGSPQLHVSLRRTKSVDTKHMAFRTAWSGVDAGDNGNSSDASPKRSK